MTTTALAPRQAELMLSGPLGSLDHYIQAANSIPVLSAEEERELAVRFREANDLDAAKRSVLAHLRFVVHVARGYAGYGLQLGDLIQEGNVGLMKAVKRFDPEVGVRLVSFAVHWIRAEIHEFVLRNWRLVKVATTKAQRKLFFNLRKAKKRLGWLNKDETEAVANDLGVTAREVTEMEQRLSRPRRLVRPRSEDDEDFAPGRLPAEPEQRPGASRRSATIGKATRTSGSHARSRSSMRAAATSWRAAGSRTTRPRCTSSRRSTTSRPSGSARSRRARSRSSKANGRAASEVTA